MTNSNQTDTLDQRAAKAMGWELRRNPDDSDDGWAWFKNDHAEAIDWWSPSTSRDDLQLLLVECKRRGLWGTLSHRINKLRDASEHWPYFTEALLLPTRDLCEVAVVTLNNSKG